MNFSIPEINWSALGPQVSVVLTALAVMALDAIAGPRRKPDGPGNGKWAAIVSLTGLAVAFFLNARLWNEGGEAFNGSFSADNFCLFLNGIVLLGTVLTIGIAGDYLERIRMHVGEFYQLLLYAVFGMMLLNGSRSLILTFLGIETLSIPLYVMAGFHRTNLKSVEASLKYFLLGAFATGFLLYGIALLYGASGSTDYKAIREAIAQRETPGVLVLAGIALLTVGLCFKVSAVPFHMWTPDVYEGAPTPITAFMSTAPKAAALAAFFRLYAEALGGAQTQWTDALALVSVLTMCVGNVLAIAQSNVKRMLAYSSIAHVGYLLLALVAYNKLASQGLLFYMTAYTFMNLGAFGVIVAIGKKGDEADTFEHFHGLGTRRPALAALMALFMFSLAGIPPTAGFVGKFYIFSAAMKSGLAGYAVIGVLNAVVSVFYYLRLTVVMYMRPPESDLEPSNADGPLVRAALAVAAAGVLALGVFPNLIARLIEVAGLG